MATQQAPAESGQAVQISARFEQEVLPPRHPDHATPDTVVRRRVEFRFPDGAALLEQSDYGHPGRFNPYQVRRTPPRLAGRQEELIRIAEALAALAA